MKRLLISTFALGALLNMAAVGPADLVKSSDKPLVKNPKELKLVNKPTRADGGQMFGYCFDIYDGVGIPQPGVLMEGVMEIPNELSQEWKGNTVTGVNIGFGQSSNKKVNVYITKDLDGVPALMQEAEMTKEIDWNYVALDNPYPIDGDAFYIGYQTVIQAQGDYPLAIDGVYTQLPYGDIIGLFMDNEGGYYNYGDQFGSVCIRAEISGQNFKDFGGMIDTVYQDEMIGVQSPFDLSFSFLNTGLKSISEADLTVTVGGVAQNPEVLVLGEGSTDESKEETTNDMIPFGTTGFISIQGLVAESAGNLPIVVTINSLGAPDGSSSKSDIAFQTQILAVDALFDKSFLVEEYTGTWCGWCPRGIVGMTQMERNHGKDGFIGIAVHYGNNDPMEAPTYSPLAQYYYQQLGFPTALLNRTMSFDPNPTSLEDLWTQYSAQKSPIKIELDATYDEDTNTLSAVTNTTFGFDAKNPPYAIAFVITENEVGPYAQTNYYAGGENGAMGGWQDLGQKVPTIYNEVARYITGTGGIDKSIPAEVVQNTPYEFKLELPLREVTNLQGQVIDLKINYCTLIAMVLDTESGEVMNAAKLSLKGMSGVESLVAEPNDGVYRVYNTQGVKVLETKDASSVNNLPAGIYIVNGKKVKL